MKRLIYIVLAMIVPMAANCEFWFDDNAEWIVKCRDSSVPPFMSEDFFIATGIHGTQTVDGKEARVVYVDGAIAGYIDTSRYPQVYFTHDFEAEGWQLLYDFGLAPGESCCVSLATNPACKYRIGCVGYIDDYKGSGFRAMEIAPYMILDADGDEFYCYRNEYWIFGIGSEYGLLDNCPFGLEGFGHSLYSVQLDGKTVYGEDYAVLEEPKSLVRPLSFDLYGRRVSATSGCSIVISADGRKFYRP